MSNRFEGAVVAFVPETHWSWGGELHAHKTLAGQLCKSSDPRPLRGFWVHRFPVQEPHGLQIYYVGFRAEFWALTLSWSKANSGFHPEAMRRLVEVARERRAELLEKS